MASPQEDAGFAAGIRLFNRGKFFEAHEIWEEEWKQAKGDERIFYQGIIQAAVALLHVDRGNYAGAISVYLKSRTKLDQFPSVWMGIDLDRFRSELTRYFAAVQTILNVRGRNWHPPGTIQIAGAARAPAIRWASDC